MGGNPVVVTRSFDKASAEEMKQTVLDMMGPEYGIGHVFTLDQLGFDDWPINETGKVMKLRLQEKAIELLSGNK